MRKGWQTKKLGEVSAISYGFTECATSEPVGPRFLRIMDIQDDRVEWDFVPFCKIDSADVPKYRLVTRISIREEFLMVLISIPFANMLRDFSFVFPYFLAQLDSNPSSWKTWSVISEDRSRMATSSTVSLRAMLLSGATEYRLTPIRATLE